jgi:hypothetical protein
MKNCLPGPTWIDDAGSEVVWGRDTTVDIVAAETVGVDWAAAANVANVEASSAEPPPDWSTIPDVSSCKEKWDHDLDWVHNF